MKLDQVRQVLEAAAELTNHRQFVVVGSLSVLGALVEPPPRMVQSIDVDFFLKFDPGRAGEINARLGEQSEFALMHGFYADAVSPQLVSAPAGWEARLVQVPFASGIVGWFLEPNDAAVAKLMRGEASDLEWVRAGLHAGVLSGAVIEARLPSVANCLPGEPAAALARLKGLISSAERRPSA